jgi:hypothetical protein
MGGGARQRMPGPYCDNSLLDQVTPPPLYLPPTNCPPHAARARDVEDELESLRNSYAASRVTALARHERYSATVADKARLDREIAALEARRDLLASSLPGLVHDLSDAQLTAIVTAQALRGTWGAGEGKTGGEPGGGGSGGFHGRLKLAVAVIRRNHSCVCAVPACRRLVSEVPSQRKGAAVRVLGQRGPGRMVRCAPLQ